VNATTVDLGHLCTAQFGEDRVLWQVFRGRCTGYFIEIGAYDGRSLSNTYFLEQLGWHGLLVEPIVELCRCATTCRPRSTVVHAACSRPGAPETATFTVAKNVPVLSFLTADADHVERCRREGAELVEITVPVRTVDDILLALRKESDPRRAPWKANQGWDIDVVSIDTEGCELDVLRGFSLERFKPRVLVIENDKPSGTEVEPYLVERGYRKFHRQTINDFYVRNDLTDTDLCLTNLAPSVS